MNNELYHYGIQGQKWGQRNGPPYPLSYDAHSSREKKENSVNRLNNYTNAIYKVRPINYSTSLKERKISDEDRRDYRKDMLKRYKNNSKKYDFYKNASKTELEEDIRKKQQLRRNLCIAAGVLGVTAGIYVAYRYGVFDSLVKQGAVKDLTDDIIRGTAYSVADEMDLVLNAGSSLDRMTAFKDFDVKNVTGPLFVSYEKNDVNAYKLFLQDFSGTGERYHVKMQAVKDIVAPNKEHTKEIFDAFRDNDAFNECLAKLYGEKIGKNLTAEDIRNFSDNKFFDVSMWSIAKKGASTDMLVNEARARGYNAFRDFHDIDGKFTKTPLILLNSKSDIIKTGESFVTESDRKMALKELREASKELPISARLASLGASIVDFMPGSSLSSFFNMKPN